MIKPTCARCGGKAEWPIPCCEGPCEHEVYADPPMCAGCEELEYVEAMEAVS